MDRLVSILKKHFDFSYAMLEELIAVCPDDLWHEKRCGFVCWQQIVHALAGTRFWLRGPGITFAEPFPGKEIFPELDGVPTARLTREDIGEYSRTVKAQADDFFSNKDDDWLAAPCAVTAKLTNLDAIAGQLRHIIYHVGHLDAILRAAGRPAAAWRE